MNGCEAERKTSSGPRGLSRTQRGTQKQPLHLEHKHALKRRDMTSCALYRAHWVNQQTASPALYFLFSTDIILEKCNGKCFGKKEEEKKIKVKTNTHTFVFHL